MARTRPLIGVTTQTLHAIEGIPQDLPVSWVMNQRYVHAVMAAGGVPVLIPLLAEDPATLRAIYERIDGVLIPGGVDIDPAYYRTAAPREARPPRPRPRHLRTGDRALGREGRQADPRPLPRPAGAQRRARRLPLAGPRRGTPRLAQARLLPDRRLGPRTPRPRGRGPRRFTPRRGPRRWRRLGQFDAPSGDPRASATAWSPPPPPPTASSKPPKPTEGFAVGVQWHPEMFEGGEAGVGRLFEAFVDAANGSSRLA